MTSKLRTGIAEYEGVRLSIVEAGPITGPVVLFLHGFAFSKAVWRKQLESELAQRYRLVALDLRGHGASQPKEGIAFASGHVWANDIETVRKKLGAETMVLVGWSYGANVIGDYLAEYGQTHVRAVVVVSDGPAVTPKFFTREFGNLIPRLLSPDAAELKAANRSYAKLVLAHPEPNKEELDELTGIVDKTPVNVRSSVLARKDLDVTKAYMILDTPLLLQFADEDHIVNVPEATQLFKASNPHAKTITYQSGHAIFWQQPEEFNSDLDKFIQEL